MTCRRTSPSIRFFRIVPCLLVSLITSLFCAPFYYSSAESAGVNVNTQDMQRLIKQFFPSITREAVFDERNHIWTAYQLDEVVGYAFISSDFVDFKGFSGEKIDVFIGLTADGTLCGTHILNHHEPIFLHGLGPQPLQQFIAQYPGTPLSRRIIIDGIRPVDQREADTVYFDGVTKATVSIIIVNDTIASAARQVARQLIPAFAQQPRFRIRAGNFEPLTWQELVDRQLVNEWIIPRHVVEQGLGRPISDYLEFASGSRAACRSALA